MECIERAYDDDGGSTHCDEDEEEEEEEEDERLVLRARLMDSENEARALRAQLESQRLLLASLQSIVTSSGEQQMQALRAHDQPPLVEAAIRGDAGMLALLLGPLGVNPSRAPSRAPSSAELDAALQAACQHGRLQAALELIAHGADVRADHSSALIWACHNGHAELSRALIDAGADPCALHGCPLRTAVRAGHREVAEVLVEHGAPPFGA